MRQPQSLIIKTFIASAITLAMCVGAAMFSIDASAQDISADKANKSEQMFDATQNGLALPDGNTLSQNTGNADSVEIIDTPHNTPEAFTTQDGGQYQFEEEIVHEDGTSTYVYTQPTDTSFEDGGLGDAELIISTE